MLLTHHHWDHVFEARSSPSASGSRCSPTSKTAELLEGKVDETFADGDVIETGDLRIEVIHTPGHCADHCALDVQRHRLL